MEFLSLTRLKTIKLRNSTSVTFHWVKGHAGLKGNERADYLAKTYASYNTTIAYDVIPIIRGKQSLEDHYTKIWNAIYVNSANASHIKLFIPTILHRLSLSLWPNFLLTQFLTNHGSFRSYLHKINKTSLTKLQLSGKGYTKGPSPYDRMQLILKGPKSSIQISYPTSGSEAPHKYRQHHKLLQKYLPSTSRRIQRKLNFCNTPKRTAQVLT